MMQPHAPMQLDPTLLGRALRRWLGVGPVLSLIVMLVMLPRDTDGAIAEHEINALPGWDHPLPSRQYSGFISAEDVTTPGHEKFLHYVFVEAENSPETAPVVLWTNGGPGCSSLEGYMNEMGPLRPDPADPDGQQLTRNPYTWNLHANMLYLEHGVGVGFSYTNGRNVELDDESDARDVHWFLRNFFFPKDGAEGFGEYATNEFYLTGESYAGVYIPHIANTIRLGNLDHSSSEINIVGFMIGNGCSGSETFNCGDPVDNTDFLKSSGGMKLDFLHGHGLVGTPLFDDIVESCPDPKPDWGYDSQCSGLTQEPMCGLDIQDFIDQFFNTASCMGPIPTEYLGQGYESSGKWEAEGGLPGGFTADALNAAWNSSWWPMISGADPEFVAQHGLTGENTWRMDRPGPQLEPLAIPDAWPLNADGSVPQTDPLGRRVNLECCVKYDEAFERLGTVNIYNIDDQACTPGSLSRNDDAEEVTPASLQWSHERILGAKGMHLDSATSVRATAFDAAAIRKELHKPGYSTGLEEPSRDLDACGGASFNVAYFNRPDVQRALNVFEEGPVATAEETGWSWAECARAPFFNYTKTTKSHTELYQQHLVPEMRVTIFSGDVDACVPYLGTMRWVDDVVKNTNGIGDREPWPEIGPGWTNWNVDANVAGYFSTWSVTDAVDSDHTFTFATVKGAGHMVPEVKPKSALSLFYRFLNDLPMDHSEATPLTIEQQPALSAADPAARTLAVVASGGTAPYSYEWFRNDVLIEGTYGPELVLSEEQLSADAEYHCHVISALGSTLWTEGVHVAARPPVGPSPAPAPAGVVDENVYEMVATFAFVGGLGGGLCIGALAWIARMCSKRHGSSYIGGDSSSDLMESFK
jgi:carboxypeptidase C (cathepsin A)